LKVTVAPALTTRGVTDFKMARLATLPTPTVALAELLEES
jgi:hypothetical protein